MDYTQQHIRANSRKVVRYVRLYGFFRTLAKVRAYYHMNKVYPGRTSEPVPTAQTGKHVGLLGCGKFAFANVGYYLNEQAGSVIRGVMDTDLNKAISLGQHYRADYCTTNARDIIDDPHIDLIYIASNHASHAEYAIAAIRQGKAVHIEKPHVVNLDQLMRLCTAIRTHTGRVQLGFNRPESPLGKQLKEQLDCQTGPAMLNWFVAGHAIDAEHWYFSEEEGGRILGNLCHWIDFTLRLIPPANRYPLQINPTRSGRTDCDISVSYLFGDGSIATITFSAKGHTFDGVRESLNVHKGNLLAQLTDFKTLRLDIGPQIRQRRLWFRDHGHRASIRKSYLMRSDKSKQESVTMIWESGYLMLKTKEALETNTVITVADSGDSFL